MINRWPMWMVVGTAIWIDEYVARVVIWESEIRNVTFLKSFKSPLKPFYYILFLQYFHLNQLEWSLAIELNLIKLHHGKCSNKTATLVALLFEHFPRCSFIQTLLMLHFWIFFSWPNWEKKNPIFVCVSKPNRICYMETLH